MDDFTPRRVYNAEQMQLIKEYGLRNKALSSVENYIGWMRGSLPLFDFDPAPHHKIIIEAIEALERGDIRRLMITVPVGHGKSHYANLAGLSWIAARNPHWSILAISGRLSRATDFARQRRKILETPEWQQLAGVAPDPKLTAPELIPYGQQGAMHAASIGQGIAGMRCDLLCTDDAIASLEDASTTDKREKMYQWYISEARTRARLGEGNFLRELFIGSRWFSDDLQGRLLEEEGDTWHLIELPFMCTDPATDPLHRQLDELLWPVDMFTPTKVAEIRRDPVSFQALYQQHPLNASGSWADPASLQVVPKKPPDSQLRFYCAMDLATSAQTTADYTVVGVVGVDHNLDMWIVEWHRRRMEPQTTVELLQDIRDRWRPDRFLIDNDLGSKMFGALARVTARTSGDNIIPHEVAMGGQDKETRAISVPGMLRSGQLKTIDGPWVEGLKAEIGTFPRTGSKYFDDQIDVLSLLSRYHPKMAAGSPPPVTTNTPEIEGQIMTQDGQQYLRGDFNSLLKQHDQVLSAARQDWRI